MYVPFDFWNFSLLLSTTAIILLISAQLIFVYDGRATLIVDKKKIGRAAIVVDVLFFITVVIHIYKIATPI